MIRDTKLRRVMDMPYQDAHVYEHPHSKERRVLTGKSIACHGLDAAWQMAKPKKAAKQETTPD